MTACLYSLLKLLPFSILCVALFTACGSITTHPSTSEDEVDGRELFLSLLMPMSYSGGSAFCHSFYYKPAGEIKKYHRVIFLSAGHCPTRNNIGDIVVHGQQSSQIVKTLLLIDNWTVEAKFSYDFYMGSIVERRPVPTFFTIDWAHSIPRHGEKVLTVATPAVIGQTPELQWLRFREMREDGLLIFEAEKDIREGFSGAPVATDKGRLLGILLGSGVHTARLYAVMPITRVIHAIRPWYKW